MDSLIPSLFSFLALTVVLGGAAAFVSGRALAGAWRSPVNIVPVVVALEAAVRFLHYALAEEGTGLGQAVLGVLILGGFAAGGFVLRRRRQMATQYHWLARAR